MVTLSLLRVNILKSVAKVIFFCMQMIRGLKNIYYLCESGVENGKKPDFHLIFQTKQPK